MVVLASSFGISSESPIYIIVFVHITKKLLECLELVIVEPIMEKLNQVCQAIEDLKKGN